MEASCSAVEQAFVLRTFEKARDLGQRFFEQHFKKNKGSPLHKNFTTCVDLTNRTLSKQEHAIARVAAVLLQCSYELHDPDICDYVTFVYRQTRTPFSYDLGFIWIRLQLHRGCLAAVQKVVETSLQQAVLLRVTPRFDYEKYRSFLAVLVHDVLFKDESSGNGNNAEDNGESEGKGIADDVGTQATKGESGEYNRSKILTVIENSVLSVVDKERFRNELEAETMLLTKSTETDGDINEMVGINNNENNRQKASNYGQTQMPKTEQGDDHSGGDTNTTTTTISSSAVDALRTEQVRQSGDTSLSTMTKSTSIWSPSKWFQSFIPPPAPNSPVKLSVRIRTLAFWVALAKRFGERLQRYGESARALTVPVVLVVLAIVFRKTMAQIFRRFAEEMRT